MTLRKLIFWLHLVVGITAGLIVLVMSVTGVMLAYQRQIIAWAEGRRVEVPSVGTARLSMTALLSKIRETQPEASPSMITVQVDPSAPVVFTFGRDHVVLVNPYTAAVLGNGSDSTRQAFHFITDWHRWLGTSEKGRAVGRGITGGCNLAFFFLVVSGFYLWWPRNWSWSSVRAVVLFNRKTQGKARHWNWHNVIGFWCAPILFAIVLTGVLMSYPWATNLLYRLTGNEAPPARGEGGRDRGSSAVLNLGGLDRAWNLAAQEIADWKSITLRAPSSASGPYAFTIDQSDGGRPDKRRQLTIDAKTGEVVSRETFDSYNSGRRLRLWARFAHTGEVGGFLGQLLAMLASAGAAVLVYTGFALAWRRFREREN